MGFALAVTSAAGLPGCGLAGKIEAFFTGTGASEKTPQPSVSDLATKAKRTFWENFRAGRRERLPDVVSLLTAAYIENPRDPEVALLLGHAHLWALVERGNGGEDPRVSEHAILADEYFEEAQRLSPEDHRIPGWLGAVKLALGKIHQDEARTLEGYYMLEEAARQWPEFNHFSAAYPMSLLSADDPIYRNAIEHLWRNVEACFGVEGRTIDRRQPAVDPALETHEGPRRACWNSSLAPHNLEGFFLNMGDMVLKAGDKETAAKLYRIAQSSNDYGTWPYRPLLEERLARIDERAASFLAKPPREEPEMMFTSRYNCMACHQAE